MIQRFESRVEWCLITKMGAMIFMENYGSGTIQDYFRDNYSVQEALVYSSKMIKIPNLLTVCMTG